MYNFILLLMGFRIVFLGEIFTENIKILPYKPLKCLLYFRLHVVYRIQNINRIHIICNRRIIAFEFDLK